MKSPWILRITGQALTGLLILALAILTSPSNAGDLQAGDLYISRWEGKSITVIQPTQARRMETRSQPTVRKAVIGGPENLLVDPNERFNRAWLSSYAPEAASYEGKTAGRKLVQMWARAAWQEIAGDRYDTVDYLVEHLDASREYTPHYGQRGGDMDYRLSVSTGDVELKLHYSFY